VALHQNIEERKMFGGIGFLVNGNLLLGVRKDSQLVRLDRDEGDEALQGPWDSERVGRGWPEGCKGRCPVERLDSPCVESSWGSCQRNEWETR
jgi:hypothetical protein